METTANSSAEAPEAEVLATDQGAASLDAVSGPPQADIDGLVAERDALQAQLEEAKELLAEKDKVLADTLAQLGKARGEVKTFKAARKPGKLRKFDTDVGEPNRDDLRELLGMADQVEIVFTLGGKEVGALSPVRLVGNAWQQGRFLVLSTPVDVQGAADQETRFDGYALLADGETLSHRSRGDVISIPAGQAVRLVNEIAF